jgi:gas vesicle structural protein
MTATMTQSSGSGRSSGSLYDVIELIIDRGLVIDVFVRLSLVGIEVITVDARVVVASVDTYLRFAEACNRVDLTGGSQPVGLPGLVGQIAESSAEGKVKGALTGAGRVLADTLQDLVAERRDATGD